MLFKTRSKSAPSGSATSQKFPTTRYLLLLTAFALIRIILIREPLNSDDSTYFHLSSTVLTGEHVIFLPNLPQTVIQQQLRFGLLVPTALCIKLLGANCFAYYLPPLVFSLFGCVMLICILRRFLSTSLILGVIVIHAVLPFETRHSSLLLVDLPAASMVLGYFLCVGAFSERSGGSWKMLLHSAICGVLLLWAYFLRENWPLLVTPGVLLLATHRRTRLLAIASFAVLFTGIIAEQLVFLYKGAAFGYRWSQVAHSLAHWYPQMDVLTLQAYAERPFLFVLHNVGLIGVLFVCVSLVAHLYCLLRADDIIVKATTLTGLITWVIFSYSLFKRDHGHILAFNLDLRFVQMFAYTSLVSIPYAILSASKGLWRLLLTSPRCTASSLSISRRAAVALGIAVYCAVVSMFFGRSSFYPGRLFAQRCEFGNVLRKVADECKSVSGNEVRVTGNDYEIRAFELFPIVVSGKRVHWEGTSYQRLVDLVRNSESEYIIRNATAERWTLKLATKAQKEHLEPLISQLASACSKRYDSLVSGDEFLLFKRRIENRDWDVRVPNMSMSQFDISAHTIEGWTIMQRDSVRLTRTPDAHLQIDCAIQGGNYITSDDGRFDVPPKQKGIYQINAEKRCDILWMWVLWAAWRWRSG